MSAETLAKRAGMTEKTLGSLEDGNPCFVSTLGRLAGKLGVKAGDLIIGSPPEPMEDGRKKVVVAFWLHADSKKFDETMLVTLLNALAKLIGATHSMEVIGVREGSIVVLVRMDAEDAAKLKAAAFALQTQLGLGSALMLPDVPDPDSIRVEDGQVKVADERQG